MNNSKILFTDLDDTLLNRQKKVSPKNAQAIQQALKAGHRIVINTGRPLIGAIPLIQELNLNQEGCYAITYNGGLIYDCYNQKTIFKKSLPMEYVTYIFQQAKEHDLYCQTYDSTHLVTAEDSPFLHFYVNSTSVPYRVDPGCPETLTEEPVKILVIDDANRLKMGKYREDLQDWAAGKIDMFYSSPNYLEHVCMGISKGDAIIKLCELLEIPLENTVAAGDAENDLPMIRTAHIGAVMCNGEDSVKAAADYITENDCDHDGVAEIIQKFILNEG